MTNRWLFRIVALAAVCVATAPSSAMARQQNPFPAPAGQYRVGRTLFEWTDSSRVDLESPNGHRRLVIWVWYPASHTNQVPQAAWIPGRWREMYVGFHDRLARITARPGSSVPASRTRTDSAITHAFENAPVAPGPEKFPLLLFAAGWGVLPLGYSNVIEDLVSHGYVVVGVVFTYYAPFSLFSDGDVAGQHEFALDIPGAPPRTYRGPVPPSVVRIMTEDLRFALAQFERIDATRNHPVAQRIDLTRIGAFGHSIGATPALRLAKEDSRIRAVASYDGNLANFIDDPSVPKPMLWVSAGGNIGSATAVTPANRGDLLTTVLRSAPVSYNAIIAGAGHNFPGDTELSTRDRGPSRIDPVRGLRVTKDYTLAFFDEQLRGVSSSLLTGASTAYAEVTLDIVKPAPRR